MIAGGASYNYGVHSMVTMVDTFLVETLTQFDRNGRYGVTFGSGGGIVGCTCKGVQPLKSGQYDTIPHIVDPPIMFESVGDGAIAGNDVL